MTSKERMLIALNLGKPDRLPVTIHQWQEYHLKKYMNGMSELEAFIKCGLDAAVTFYPAYTMPESNDWRVESSSHVTDEGITVTDYVIHTPEGDLKYQVCSNAFPSWYSEHMIKRDEDIYLYKKYCPPWKIRARELEEIYDQVGDHGILRCGIPQYQGGCYQAAQVMYGTENLIYACYDKPDFVHEFLQIILEKKLEYIYTQLKNKKVDLVETGGGGSSDTIISPALHKEFCEPYDKRIHDALHHVGHIAVYHTCGGMMSILDSILNNGCDASETLSPPEIGGNITGGRIVKEKLGSRIALIGGLDQVNVLTHGDEALIRKTVHSLFETYGNNGGYIISACDHFFEAPVSNLVAFANAARECVY